MRCDHQHKNADDVCVICHHHPCQCTDEQEEVMYKDNKIMVGKHKDESDERFDPNELSMGMEDELEHTHGNKRAAKNIAKDHLIQIPNYYSTQRRMNFHTNPPSLKNWIAKQQKPHDNDSK